MNPDDIAALESLLRQIVLSQAPAIRHAERALEILTARRHRRNGAGAHDGLLAALIDESRFTGSQPAMNSETALRGKLPAKREVSRCLASTSMCAATITPVHRRRLHQCM